MNNKMLSLVIAAALSLGVARAAEPGPAASAQQQAAQAEIDRLVERIQVLSRQLGPDADVRVIVRRGAHRAPEAMGEHGMPWPGAEGDGVHKRIRIERVGPGAGDHGGPRLEGLPGSRDGFRPGPGLGIVMAPNPAAAGVRIAAITPDSPAMKAGLRSGDVLLSVDGKTIAGNGAQAVENARALLGDLKLGQTVKLRYARQGKTYDASVKAGAIRRVMVFNRDQDGAMGRMPGRGHPMMLPPDVELDIERMGPMADCAAGDDCGLPALFQAFRWQGLNLASLDASLGRYFGTDQGVLVLSTGPELKGLQSGDVIQRVGGKPVQSPREVMRALREKDSGSQLRIDVLRERKPVSATVTVPKSRPLPFMAPPPAPAPPAPCSATSSRDRR
jgi:hypothetical protein